MNVLVLGIGNILLSDEGIGVRVIEALQERYVAPDGVEIVDGGTSGMDMLDILCGRDQLIIVDAVNSGNSPGTVVKICGDDVPQFFRTRISPHQLGLSELLATLLLLGEEPGNVILFGCQPASLDLGLALSETVAAKLDILVEMVAAELGALGMPLTLRDGDRSPQPAKSTPST